MIYKENPKTTGSGILCTIPQTGECPRRCSDCFFQSGRSYLEPLADNLPNMPPKDTDSIVRVNDRNDSNNQRDMVIDETSCYRQRFFNTAIPKLNFPDPVVLTINPGWMTDVNFYRVDPVPFNLMFIRFRTNLWNLDLCDEVVKKYTEDCGVPVVLTFMAYHEPPTDMTGYVYRQRTLNAYYAITTDAWRKVMARYEDNPLVYSCSKIEGERGKSGCKYCGNCVREYHNTIERMRG